MSSPRLKRQCLNGDNNSNTPRTTSASTLSLLCNDPARAPSHRILDAKLVEKEILVLVLTSWIGGGALEVDEYRYSHDKRYKQQYFDQCALADSSAIAFTLMDARFAVTLYHRYCVQREMDLSTVLHVWRRHLPMPESSATSAATHASVPTLSCSSASDGRAADITTTDPLPFDRTRLVPMFRIVTSEDPKLYSKVSPWLLARTIVAKLYWSSKDATSIPEGTTAFEYLGEDLIGANVLPASLQQFMLGDAFDLPIGENVLPASLQRLTFGDTFDQPIGTNVLPASLKQLTFGDQFNHPIGANVLPASLQRLMFDGSFNQPISANVLPASLQQLTFKGDFNQPISANALPASLQQLTLGGAFNQPIGVNVLPASLQQLTFNCAFNQPIGVNVLPASLQQLTLGSRFNQPIGVNVLPASLQRLTFGREFNQPIGSNVLPASLQRLTFSDYSTFAHPLSPSCVPHDCAVVGLDLS